MALKKEENETFIIRNVGGVSGVLGFNGTKGLGGVLQTGK